jgi:phage shock protein PspC (stress-responsive transcriptional regulator)
MNNPLKEIVEKSAFGVCSYLGDKMGVSHARIRMYFCYISFLTVGSPVIFYLFAAFWLNIRNYLRRSKNAVWN